MRSGITATLHQLTLGVALQAGSAPCTAVVSVEASGDRGTASSTPTSSASGGASAASARPANGKGSRGPRPRLFKKNSCQADGCSADLSALPRYNQRNHVCIQHKVADGFLRLGVEVRFCQRCGVAHPLPDFDGLKKSCRRQLAVHNSRRRKSAPAAPAAEPAAVAAPAPAAALQPEVPTAPGGAEGRLLPMDADPATVQAAGAQQGAAASSASLGASPSVSVGSAMSGAGPDSWLLLADSGSGGSGGSGGGGVPWGEGDDELAAALGLPSLDLAVNGAAPAAAPADERVCGAADECVCGACCPRGACCSSAAGSRAAAGVDVAGGAVAGCSGASLAAAPLAAGAAAGAAGRSGCMGGAAVPPEQPACRPAARAGDEPGADPVSTPLGVSSSTAAAAAAAAAEAEAEAAAAAAAPTGAPAAAVSALEQLQQQNAALYQVFVQQQLLAAQALITTAGALLNRQLPLIRSSSTASMCSVATR